MPTTQTTTAVDVTARLAEAKPITALFAKFDSRGYDAYDSCAAMLFSELDGSAEQWAGALTYAVALLSDLDDEANWLDAAEGARVHEQITALLQRYV